MRSPLDPRTLPCSGLVYPEKLCVPPVLISSVSWLFCLVFGFSGRATPAASSVHSGRRLTSPLPSLPLLGTGSLLLPFLVPLHFFPWCHRPSLRSTPPRTASTLPRSCSRPSTCLASTSLCRLSWPWLPLGPPSRSHRGLSLEPLSTLATVSPTLSPWYVTIALHIASGSD